MTSTLIRGRLLSFHQEPRSIDDHAAYAYEADGALLIEGGVIRAAGPYATVKTAAPEDVSKSTTARISSRLDSSIRICIFRRCR